VLEDNRAAFAAKQLKQGETAQRVEEEDELLKGKSGTKQLAKKDEEETAQAKFSNQGPPVQREEQPAKPNNTGLPDKLKNGIESLSGMSMDNVKVHYNSAKPQQLNALAYAQGTDIHVGPGQEKHVPHEAWHVAQQAQGRVKPTMQMKGGVPVNDDKGLEHEADVMGRKALQMLANPYNARANSIFTHSSNELLPSTIPQAVVTRVIQRVPIDLSGAQEIKPGPPATLRLGSYYYKVFGTKEQADNMETQWNTADQAGVLTPTHKVLEVTRNGNHRWAFRSKGVAGTFFQFSKGGHTARVTGWINIQTNQIFLGRLLKTFEYVQNHIGDGQGFFENSDGGNIWFIDINNAGTTPNAADVVNAINERLNAI